MRTRLIQTDGLTQRVLEAGDGSAPLVLLIHGFPELGISWRAQVVALAAAGYHAVAPDMRGYGGTDKPEGAAAYTILHLVGDMVDLVRALGHERCFVVGHDWGSAVAWHCALIRPDLFRAVVGLSVPFQPRRRGGPPIAALAEASRKHDLGEFYINQFQDPEAHRELDADPAAALRAMFHAYDGATPAADQATGFQPVGVSMMTSLRDPGALPPWMMPDHFTDYVDAFARGGFAAPINWYRAMDLNWALTAGLQGKTIEPPALFIVGERDPVRNYMGRHEATQADWMPRLTGIEVMAGAGHWLQQERAAEISARLVAFFGAHAEG